MTSKKRSWENEMPPQNCYRCGKPLIPEKTMWLELNAWTGEFHVEGAVPEEQSQGCFPFGMDCEAKAIGHKVTAHKNWLRGNS